MIYKKIIAITLCFILPCFVIAQKNIDPVKPKLVVGLVIDQMRWDYLFRYTERYGEGGFKRLIREGFNCDNTIIPYVPTYTGPGHTCIYTGSVPSIHGIVGNDWYEKDLGKTIYCTDDTTETTVGSATAEGKMSPRNLWVNTIGDELRLSNNFKSKVIGIALKDRASILPAGLHPTAAYWYDDQSGKWITGSYYLKDLPDWVKKENEKRYPDKAMSADWNLLLPSNAYDMSTTDEKNYEGKIPGDQSNAFPHRLSQIIGQKYQAFKYTPFAATYTFDMAKSAIENENLGAGKFTDMLAISISSTDYMGHTFGPNSIEAEDTYLRLDKDIADFLKFLDRKEGAGNYVLFLSADHGVAHTPGFLKENGLDGGIINASSVSITFRKKMQKIFPQKNIWMLALNNQIYLNEDQLQKDSIDISIVEKEMIKILEDQPFIERAFVTKNLVNEAMPEREKEALINGYNPKRSGQIGFIFRPGYIAVGSTGTTHGAWNNYDAHIPLIFFGNGIRSGKSTREVYMTDIAPTIAALLKIQMPDGSIGKVISEAIK